MEEIDADCLQTTDKWMGLQPRRMLRMMILEGSAEIRSFHNVEELSLVFQ
jgi:hypothetical protein